MISIFFALGGVAAYTFYSREYDPLCEKSKNTATSALILYGYAAVFLFILTIVSSLKWQTAWIDFELPTNTKLWAKNLGISQDRNIDIGLSLWIMVTCYAASIVAESKSRSKLNIASFDVAYQINAAVVVALSGFFKFSAQGIDTSEILGCIVVLIGSFMPLIYRLKKDKDFPKGISIWTVLSGVFCGIALITDANFTKQLIFAPQFSWERTPVFIFYEAITFGFPFIVVFLYFINKFGKKVLKESYWIEKKSSINYWKSAIYSSFYFLFSVFAFSLDSALIVPALFAAAPLINVKFDPRERHIVQVKIEYVGAFLVLIGLLLIAHIVNF